MSNNTLGRLRPNPRTWFSKKDWRERVITFDPSWYLVCMGTGIHVQLLASNFPYPTGWTYRLGYVFWILDIVLFVFFTCMSFTRLLLYPKLTFAMFSDFQQSCYLGAVVIAWETIGTGLVIFYSNHDSAVYVAQVFFWIAVVSTILVTCGGMYAMLKKQEPHKLEQVTGVWFLQFIPMIVLAAYGSNLATSVSLRNGSLVLTVSFLSLSLGLGLSFCIMGIYLWRLMTYQLPPREAIVSTFVPIGPVSMGAYAVANLSKALSQYIIQETFSFRQPWEAAVTPETRTAVAEMIMWLGVISALFLLGIATFFLIEAFTSVLTRIPKSFNIGQWSFVFPCGVYANAWCRLSTLLRNDAMKGWATTCIVGTVLFWLMCALCSFYKGVWRGNLFFSPGLHGWMEEKEYNKLNGKVEPSNGNNQGAHSSASGNNSNTHLHGDLHQRRPLNDGTYQNQADGLPTGQNPNNINHNDTAI